MNDIEMECRRIGTRIRDQLEAQDISSSILVRGEYTTRTYGDGGKFIFTVEDGGWGTDAVKASSHDPEQVEQEFLRRKGWQETQRLQLTQSAAE